MFLFIACHNFSARQHSWNHVIFITGFYYSKWNVWGLFRSISQSKFVVFSRCLATQSLVRLCGTYTSSNTWKAPEVSRPVDYYGHALVDRQGLWPRRHCAWQKFLGHYHKWLEAHVQLWHQWSQPEIPISPSSD